MSTSVWPTDREPYHGDIVQGRLGNCFLIASLQALASCQPQLLKTIISLSPLTCSFYRQGERVEVPIVLQPITDEYPYCRSTLKDVEWPYIIEQAYAQFYGGRFENLTGGNTSEAFYDLLGKPVEEYEPNDSEIWEKIEKGLTEKTMLVTCGAIVTNNKTTINSVNGLLINHAYVVLATFTYERTREKYVLIHNPHGIKCLEKENVRARDAFFTSLPKSHTLWANTNGTQLMSWSDLKRSCNRIQICYLNCEPYQILRGNWLAITSGGCSNFSTFYRNPLLLLPESYSNSFILVLGHTLDQRQVRATAEEKLSYNQLGITIIELKTNAIPTQDNYEIICQSKFWNKREVALNVNIESKQGQKYGIVLSTYYPNITGTFWLQVFAKQQLSIIEFFSWQKTFQQTIDGQWQQGNAGGRLNKSSSLAFYSNPAYLITVPQACSVQLILHPIYETFVSIDQHHPIGVYVLTTTGSDEPKFTRARSISRIVNLNPEEEYYLIPACFQAGSFGKFQLHAFSDVEFTLDKTERKLSTPPPQSAPTEKNPKALSQLTPNKTTLVSKKSTTTTRTATRKVEPKFESLPVARNNVRSLAKDYDK